MMGWSNIGGDGNGGGSTTITIPPNNTVTIDTGNQNTATYTILEQVQQTVVPFLTADSCTINGQPYVITASSEVANQAGFQSFNACSQTIGGGWLASSPTTGTLSIELPAAQTITEYSLNVQDSNYPGRFPSAWTFNGSDNGTTWTTLDSRTGQSMPAGSTDSNRIPAYYTIATPGSYKYYQISITASNSSADYVGFFSLGLYDGQPSYQPLPSSSNLIHWITNGVITICNNASVGGSTQQQEVSVMW